MIETLALPEHLLAHSILAPELQEYVRMPKFKAWFDGW